MLFDHGDILTSVNFTLECPCVIRLGARNLSQAGDEGVRRWPKCTCDSDGCDRDGSKRSNHIMGIDLEGKSGMYSKEVSDKGVTSAAMAGFLSRNFSPLAAAIT